MNYLFTLWKLSYNRKVVSKTLLIMKMTAFILLVTCMQLSAAGYSQNVTLSLNNVSLQKVFTEINNQTGYQFFYKDALINKAGNVSIEVKNTPVENALNQCFKNLPVTFSIVEKTIIVKEAKPDANYLIEVPPPISVTGSVMDAKTGESIVGVTVRIEGTSNGVITDVNGKFTLKIPKPDVVLVFSCVGYDVQRIVLKGQMILDIRLMPSLAKLDEVVVVGYGSQKKASVVGAISTTTSKELERTGGVTNLAYALTGNLPGVTTIQTASQPGKDDPKIYIRGQSTWNGGEPYILVDGVERRMNDLDLSEVDNISVLKDASATAVFGVKGANGVILINTKRGVKGKPTLSISANSTMKIPSRMIDKLDSYNTLHLKNESIEREVILNEAEWVDYTPQIILERYRNQQSLKYPEAYPNIDWQKESIKSAAMDQRVNLNVTGGTDFVKYFTALAYTHEGDLLKIPDNGLGYKPRMGYDRFNFRSNLDFNLTKSTMLKINLAGIYGITNDTWDAQYDSQGSAYMIAAYVLPPDAFMPKYSDGFWGKSPLTDQQMTNSLAQWANFGSRQTRKTDLTADFNLTQKLDFISKGLSISGSVSFDNHFETVGGIFENGTTNYAGEWINPAIEDMGPNGNPNDYIIRSPIKGINQFDWVHLPWVTRVEDATGSLSTLRRRLFYQGQVNYARSFGRNDITVTGVFNREQLATGSEFQRYREDWVFRTTYNYDNRYLAELNGAYNGSEKFGPGYRFDFFPSAAVGWRISSEKFMKNFEWLNNLKLRYSYGLIGDDGGISQRWLYNSQWSYGSNAPLGENVATVSPYTWYKESMIGNPNIHWEKVTKSNLGLEMAVLKNMLSANIEYFKEDRTDILLLGSSRSIPVYFGGTAPTANVGRVQKKGYEVELRFNKNLQDWNFWMNASFTHAVDKILYKEEPMLNDPHLLAQGFQIDQTKATKRYGFYNTWDEVYASTKLSSGDNGKLPGNYFVCDYNGDGVMDYKDSAPYGYSSRPQNTFNYSFGADYKGFSFMLQFYGVNNVTRYVSFGNFYGNRDVAFTNNLDFWTKDNLNASSFLPRWKTSGESTGDYYLFDGSYLRLKNAEVAYTFKGDLIKRYRLSSLKFYLNGNNLFFWSKLPDDREQGTNALGTYPSAKRINLGVDIKF